MAEGTRRIGLSLGADLCWPLAFEEILRRLDPCISWKGEKVRVEVKRVTIEPFDLQQPCPYDLVIDRLTHWYHTSREWIKKSVIMDGLYVFNNPWSVQSMEKQTSYCALMHLGLNVPRTFLVPPKEYEPSPDLQPTLERYAKLFDLAEVGERLGFPMYMKPYDGGAWVGVTRLENADALKAAYEQSGKRVMHLQAAVPDFDRFIRCVGVGPQTRMVKYAPDAPLHDRYTVARPEDVVDAADASVLQDLTLTVNAFFGWDFNSCEALRSAGTWYPIDFANPCPDSQVTSLHYHFPWLLGAKIRWALFCAVTRRPVRRTLNWQPYYDVAARGLPYRERLAAYGKLAREHFDAAAFEDFCAEHLADLGAVIDTYFQSDHARDTVRKKVAALFPSHEVDEFTELFFQRIQQWRRDEGARASVRAP